MDNFETRSVINKDTFRELEWHLWKPGYIKLYALLSLLFVGVIVYAIVSRSAQLAAIGIFGIIVVFSVVLRYKISQRKMWERIKETTDKEEIERVVSFAEDKIVIFDPISGGTVYINYDAIRRIAETKRIYALFTKADQFVVVNYESLTHQNKNEDFIRFIKEKCANVKWRK